MATSVATYLFDYVIYYLIVLFMSKNNVPKKPNEPFDPSKIILTEQIIINLANLLMAHADDPSIRQYNATLTRWRHK